MKRIRLIKLSALTIIFLCAFTLYQKVGAQQPTHPPVPTDGKNQVVQLCDGETFLVLTGISPDVRLAPEQAKSVTSQLMSKWYAKKDAATVAAWKAEEAALQKFSSQSKSGAKSITGKKVQSAAPSQTNAQAIDFSQRDYSIWKGELEREIAYGNQIFHDDQLISSSNGVACAMCHPNAANTHPETYPKFQVQLKKVALLRDMINWCIENPCRGQKLAADDPKMRALEAYIMSQRKGVAMEFGKH